MTAPAAPANARFSSPDTLPPTHGFSHVVELSGNYKLIYISGQVGRDENGNLPADRSDFSLQARQTFINLGKALESCGGDYANLIKVTVYLTDIATQLSQVREIRDSFINTAQPPASTTVEVSALATPDLLIEVEAIAIVPA